MERPQNDHFGLLAIRAAKKAALLLGTPLRHHSIHVSSRRLEQTPNTCAVLSCCCGTCPPAPPAAGTLQRDFKHLAVDMFLTEEEGQKVLKVDCHFGKRKALASIRTCTSHVQVRRGGGGPEFSVRAGWPQRGAACVLPHAATCSSHDLPSLCRLPSAQS